MFKKYFICALFAPAAVFGMTRIFVPEFKKETQELSAGEILKINSVLDDIENGRVTSNYRLFSGNFGEWTFRNGDRLYFYRGQNIILALGYENKRNSNKQSAHIQAMVNRLNGYLNSLSVSSNTTQQNSAQQSAQQAVVTTSVPSTVYKNKKRKN